MVRWMDGQTIDADRETTERREAKERVCRTRWAAGCGMRGR